MLRTVGVAATLGATAGCLDFLGAGSPPTPTTVEVAVGPDVEDGSDYVFVPGTEEPLEIARGSTVRFVWESNSHNIVVRESPDGADWQGHEALEDAGFVHEHTFDVPGQYEIVCEPHEVMGGTATIVVR